MKRMPQFSKRRQGPKRPIARVKREQTIKLSINRAAIAETIHRRWEISHLVFSLFGVFFDQLDNFGYCRGVGF